MEKYQRKETIVVKEYLPGMEDGFSCKPLVYQCRWKDENGIYKQCHKCKLDIEKLPYISYGETIDYIRENSILIRFEDEGDKDVFFIEDRSILLGYENITRKEKLKKILK